ncbi:ShlB/FhaC/HecB family hemolysin secretion/activation protein [Sporomusa sp. KB1]|jgi:hemolysin activation/secretion protein|uniref:ShlB/FhaC/HecB family hemolysin secretion/activation protein n=1 Tax=Sporomusa sp. KB1 TaxID=943346 RepID=UPI0011A476DA|nr:ShlB/FhaC/HecB family hemolysin secretion/activation protein [Sporomusa sp. KB1]TWH48348.1 hemolysin activation/secretion protein [Sporomusa sp. KB1]
MIQNTHKDLLLAKICVLVLIILFTATSLTWAAPPSRTDIEEQNRKARQEDQARRQREQGQDVFLQKGKQGAETVKLPNETPSFIINTIKIEGDEEGRFPWMYELTKKYQGQEIGWQGINIIVKVLTNAFIDRGYVTTRVLIPQQDIATGVLTLQVVPGTIKDFKLSDPAIRADWKSAFPTRPGDILNLRDLEQGLEQMKRVPSQDAEMQLLPGDKPGESIVQITVNQKKPWKVVLSLDDSGSKATGKLQKSETFSLDNLFGINDLFNISFNSDAERKGDQSGTKGDSFSYSFPQGYWTYSLSSSVYKYHQTIDNQGTIFVSSGRTRNLELKAEKLVYRDQTRKTSLAFSLIKSRSKSYIDDTEIEIQRRKTTAAKLALNHKQYNGQAVVDYTVAYKRGVPWLGAQDDPSAGQSNQPTTHYNIWTLDISLTAPVTIGKTKASYNATLHGQYTKDMLYAAEFLSIGNRYTVRGFDGEQTLAAENGWYLRNEISVPIKETGPEIYLALDVGQIGGASAGQSPGKSLVGSTLGLRGTLAGAQYEVFIGKAIKRPAGMDVPDHVLGFQLLYQI